MSQKALVTVETNLRAFNTTLAEYQRVSGLTTTQALTKKAADVAYRLSAILKGLSPAKGSIRSTMEGALRSGSSGIFIRPSIRLAVMQKYGASVALSDKDKYLAASKETERSVGAIKGLSLRFGTKGKTKKTARMNGKSLNIQQLSVARELNMRESGRGYLSFAARMNLKGIADTKLIKFLGRVKQQVSSAGLDFNGNGQTLTMTYGGATADNGQPVTVGTGMKKPKQQAAIAQALAEATADMRVYIARKHAEALQASVNKAVAAARMEAV